MKSFDIDGAYRLAGNLLKVIQNGELAALSDFGVSHAIYEEITEELERSGENVETLTIPPYAAAFQPDSTGRIPFYGYEMEADPQSKRVASQLWSGGQKTDLTLIADYTERQGETSLTFRLLETQ
ncbi:hypothetical protein [Pseudomonas purpurea]|uniref:hypothetical protein n=1 Tax=Pseudomonas purpurea TaxID=3136737 RepID=UPI003266737B